MKIQPTLALAALLVLPFAAGAAADSTPMSMSKAESCATCPEPDLSDLIVRFAKRTGKQVIIDPRVRAQVPLAGMDPNKLTWNQLLAILTVHQYAAVEQGEWIVVVPDAVSRQLPTPVYTDRDFKAAADELVTFVLPVKNVCAASTVPVLRPLMPQAAHMAAYPDSNTLILSDHAANVRRIIAVLDALERSAAAKPVPLTQCPGRSDAKGDAAK
ncbi:MAG TPA: secretin N-terminal domain-containing protein [Steroidobacteraceae bacterium]|nr:secretin N-terminal domain-containing protein [Steroidobacteraceae bacterium]